MLTAAGNAPAPLLLATGNPAKQDALRQLLAALPLTPLTPAALGLAAFAPPETGDTHLQIAEDKAIQWSQQTDLPVIATDGGLVVPILGAKWESRYTHRFAGPAADDAERRRRLLDLLQPYAGLERQASWVEALAIAQQGQVLHSWAVAGSSGLIAAKPQSGPPPPGFWVFPLWYFPAYGKYYGQLTAGEKAAQGDHWAALQDKVREWYTAGGRAAAADDPAAGSG